MINWKNYRISKPLYERVHSLRQEKRPEHMSKRRYVKLLMSIGHSRDAAVEAALCCQRLGLSYAAAWDSELGEAEG